MCEVFKKRPLFDVPMPTCRHCRCAYPSAQFIDGIGPRHLVCVRCGVEKGYLTAEHHQHLCNRYDEYNEALLEMNDRNDDFLGELSPSLAKDYLNCYNSMLAEKNEELIIFRDTFQKFGKGNIDYNRIRYQRDEKEWEGVNTRGILDGFEPTHDLNAMTKEWMERYSMLNLMDSNHYGWRNNDDATKSTLTYITLVEATYNAKKKIKNIFEVAEAKLCKEIKPLDKKTENA